MASLSLSYAQETAEKPTEIDIVSDRAKESTVRLVGTRLKESNVYLEGGTGFFVAPDKIATNFHVAAGPTTGPIFAKLGHKETIWRVEGVWAFDVKSDIAIFKVQGEGIPLSLIDVDTLRIGETVYLAGFPYSREFNVVDGMLQDIRSNDRWLKTTVPAYPGNSGSPTLNSKGEVIGIHVGHGYDTRPANAIKALLDSSTSSDPLEEWRKRNVVRAYVYHSEGTQKFYDSKYADAIKDFNQAIELSPEDAEIYKFRGKTKASLANHKDAIEDYDQALQFDPEISQVKRWRAESLAALGNPEHLVKYYNEWLSQYPNDAFAYEALGDIKYGIKDYQGAIADYSKAIELSPKSADAYHNRGLAKKALGQHDAAKIDFEKAKEIDPNVGE